MEATIRKIRNDLRLAMNGEVSRSLRDKGYDYRVIFGVDVPKLKIIASYYDPDPGLAETLWSEDVREMKILATMLYPVDMFSVENAEKWVKEMNNQEIRVQACMNLFQKLSFADKLVQNWIGSADEEIRTTGYWLLVRLLITKSPLQENIDKSMVIDHATSDLEPGSYFLRLSALNALRFLGRGQVELSRLILAKVESYATSSSAYKKEALDSLRFEFSNYHLLSR